MQYGIEPLQELNKGDGRIAQIEFINSPPRISTIEFFRVSSSSQPYPTKVKKDVDGVFEKGDLLTCCDICLS